jgi:hypothetical protein
MLPVPSLTFTDFFIIGVIVVVLAVDGVLAMKFGQPGTISFRVAAWSKRWPLIPFGLGLLAGHLIWFNVGGCP